MKIKQIMLVGIVFLVVPSYATAALVFQEIVTVSGYNDVVNFSFTADIDAPKYVFTVTDLSTPPEVVAVNPRSAWTDYMEPAHALFGFGSLAFTPTIGATYYGYVLADGVGAQGDLGSLMISVTTVPLPTSVLLLGSGILVIMGLKKKLFHTIQSPLAWLP